MSKSNTNTKSFYEGKVKTSSVAGINSPSRTGYVSLDRADTVIEGGPASDGTTTRAPSFASFLRRVGAGLMAP